MNIDLEVCAFCKRIEPLVFFNFTAHKPKPGFSAIYSSCNKQQVHVQKDSARACVDDNSKSIRPSSRRYELW